MGLFSSIQKLALTPSVTIGNLITKGIGAVTGKTYKTTTVKEAQATTFGKVLGTAIAGTATALGVAAAGGAVAAAGGARVVAGKAVTAATPVVAKTAAKVVTSPTTALKTVAVGGVIAGGGLAVVPKIFTATKKATKVAVPVLTGEKPLTSETVGDVAKVVGIGVGAAAVGTAAGVVAKKVMEKKEEGKAIETEKALVPETKPAQESLITGEEGQTPLTPETTTVSTGKRRYKRRRAPKMPQVRQSVRVNVISRPVATGIRVTNKRYINERILA